MEVHVPECHDSVIVSLLASREPQRNSVTTK
jgi:hypothetical protein